MLKLHKLFNLNKTPQSRPIPGSAQAPNHAGGFAWALDAWDRLDRFLVLGTEGGTFYVDEQALTVEQATNVIALLKADGPRVVARLRAIDQRILADFANFVRGEASTAVAPAEAAVAIALGLAATRASDTGESVTLDSMPCWGAIKERLR